ncbi:MAG: hypothetical protein PWQ57_2713 [Desulfovibrionales bacterium]|nr:hypothetical protein [Desulfovibrionales bacterium]
MTRSDEPTAKAEPFLAVVARYREDVSWLGELGLPYRIYNKGPEPLPGAVALPNIGREAHTYLTHILAHYPDFPDYTVFLQGAPFEHAKARTAQELRRTILDAAARGRPFLGLAWFRMVCDQLGRPHQMRDPDSKGRWRGYGKDIPVGRVFRELFGTPPPEKFVASAATGNFLVSRERILVRPRGVYQKALALVEADPQDEDNTGHALERLWQILFNGATALNP